VIQVLGGRLEERRYLREGEERRGEGKVVREVFDNLVILFIYQQM
jgi:hypothetical protein